MSIRSNGEVKNAVAALLESSAELEGLDIAVKVAAGVVLLASYVRRFDDKYRAEDLVRRVPGVLALANTIEVLSNESECMSDPELAREILAALKHVLPLCREEIRPVVRQSVVTLEGTVQFDYERDQAAAAVRRLPGVHVVVNLLRLTPEAPRNYGAGVMEVLNEPAVQASPCRSVFAQALILKGVSNE